MSNIVIEGVGHGPLKTADALGEAAKKLKHDGKVELWNYVRSLLKNSGIMLGAY